MAKTTPTHDCALKPSNSKKAGGGSVYMCQDEKLSDSGYETHACDSNISLKQAFTKTSVTDAQNVNIHGKTETIISSKHKRLKRWYWKNLLVLGFVFFFLDFCFASIRDISSSINHEKNVGVISLACLFLISMIANVVIVVFLSRFGPNKCMALAAVCHVIFSMANIYPRMYTLIPASIVIGFGRALLLGPQAVYTTTIAIQYAALTGQSSAVVIGKFAGIILLFHRLAPTIGAAIGSVVITQVTEMPDVWSGATTDILNNTVLKGDSNANFTSYTIMSNRSYTYSPTHLNAINASEKGCGVNYCHSDGLSRSKGYIPGITRFVLMGVYCSSAIIALLLLKLLDDCRTSREKHQTSTESIKREVMAIIYALKDPKLKLLVFYMIFKGVQLSFFYGDVVKAYIACTIGVGYISYAMVAFSGVSALSVLSGGWIQKYIGTNVIFAGVIIFQLSFLVLLMLWVPGKYDLPLLITMASLCGIQDGFLLQQQQSYIGHMFQHNKGAAMGALYLFRSMGQVFTLGIAPFTCMRWKIVITGVISIAAALGYVTVEILKRRPLKPERRETDNEETVSLGKLNIDQT